MRGPRKPYWQPCTLERNRVSSAPREQTWNAAFIISHGSSGASGAGGNRGNRGKVAIFCCGFWCNVGMWMELLGRRTTWRNRRNGRQSTRTPNMECGEQQDTEVRYGTDKIRTMTAGIVSVRTYTFPRIKNYEKVRYTDGDVLCLHRSIQHPKGKNPFACLSELICVQKWV